jgi:hypothetical protein
LGRTSNSTGCCPSAGRAQGDGASCGVATGCGAGSVGRGGTCADASGDASGDQGDGAGGPLGASKGDGGGSWFPLIGEFVGSVGPRLAAP